MIFESLHQSNLDGELFGEVCRWHLCVRGSRRGQVTIREIIVETGRQGEGRGRAFLERLKSIEGATSLFAKCPSDLPANQWYEKMGFIREGVEITPSGRELVLWRMLLR